ncbi:TPA: Rz1 family lipoprotein [Enterobacter mori]|uniref:Rz1 family lipoprotein n=1 Tax=Enterobacter mori TaxID=539813 RepID=UPI001C67A807|nr:Rz1 family lipoprotein [Enterobacter mori]MBW8246006.1 Rz1 family lipoprotein [Enterobacter mori]MBW8250321.1 Rz1 family lipoprotein [Enterobacter mori]HDR2543470.1 Rz1 family lipoprotein [Enterobacter mori]
MQKLKMTLFSASLIMVVGCSSKAGVQCLPQPKPPSPPAWAMMPPSNSLTLLDETFLVSEQESSATKHP